MTSIICAAGSGAENAQLLGMGIAAAVLIIVGLTILMILLGGLFMFIGAGIAKVEHRTFLKAVAAALLGGIGGSIVGGILFWIPVIGPVLGFFGNIATQIFIIKAIFNTETGKAILTWLFDLIAQFIVAVIAIIIFWGAIGATLAASMPAQN